MLYCNEVIEMSSIACLLKDGSLFPSIEDILSKRSYGTPSLGIIFQSIKDLYTNDIIPDEITVYGDLERKGELEKIKISNGLEGREAIEYISKLDVNAENIESYAFQVQNDYATRQLNVLFDRSKQLLKDGKSPIEVLAFTDLESGKIATYIGSQSKNIKNIQDVVNEADRNLIEATEGKHLYLSTGLSAWDDFTNGLFPGRLYVVSARSNDGKSTLVQNLLYNVAVEQGHKAMLITLESYATDVYNKLIQRVTGISSLRIERGDLKQGEDILYKDARKKLKDSPIIFDDSPELILPILRTKIRKAVADGVKVIIIDQLEQILVGGGGDTQAEHIKLNFISYRIKSYCREMNVPIILVHQMNRASESGMNRGKDVDPILSDLAQAGEKPADAVLMIKHKKEAQEVVETWFHWTKNRQGTKGKRQVQFLGAHALFKDIEGNSQFPDFIQDGFGDE